jgi:hypothetical protein
MMANSGILGATSPAELHVNVNKLGGALTVNLRSNVAGRLCLNSDWTSRRSPAPGKRRPRHPFRARSKTSILPSVGEGRRLVG